MQNQAPLSPARILYEELRESEDAGLLDAWPAFPESDDQAPVVDGFPGTEDIPELTPESATRRASTTSDGENPMTPACANEVAQIHAVEEVADGDSIQPRSALAAIIRLQSTEIERLALENDRLSARLNAANRFHEIEQYQRRDLEQQLCEARARSQPPAPAFDVEEIRAAAREGMSAEIKPVLVAILDLLESTLPRAADVATSAEGEGEGEAKAETATETETAVAPVPPPANLAAEVMSEFHQLPEILTRPLDELTRGSDDTDPAPEPIEHLPAPVPPREPRVRQPRPPRYQAQPSPMPSVFAWTNLFS